MKVTDVNFSLYVITDPDVSGGRIHAEVVRLALEGGATVIQYRDKRATIGNMVEVGKHLRQLTQEYGATFIVNDRPDLAMAVKADGVHLGPGDFPPEVAREILGPDMIIGASVADPFEAREAEAAGADYLIARPVFPTRWQWEGGRPVMGGEGLAKIVQAVKIPVLGAGGIGPDKLGEIFGAGAAGPCITSAIVGAPDPMAAAREFRQLLDTHRAQQGQQAAGAQA